MRSVVLLLLGALLAGCGATPQRPSPADDLVDGTPEVIADREWSRRASSGRATAGEALPPVLVDGRIHVADRRGRISAYDAASGRLVWRMHLDAGISGGPAVDDDTVVVGTRAGGVTALAPPDGEVLWEARVSSEVLALPVLSDRLVVIRSADGRLYAFDRANGSQRWLHDVSVPSLSLRGSGNPVIAGDRVLAGFENGRIQALELGSGQVAWETTVSEPRGSADLDRMRDVEGTPVVLDGRVYVAGYRGSLMALNADTGEIDWDRELSSHAGLAVDDERVYVVDSRGRIVAVDRRTGAAVWRQGDTEGLQPTAPTVHEDFVVFGDETGRLTVLAARDGRILARVPVRPDAVISEAPVSHAGGVYVLTDAGHLLRYGLRYREAD